MLDFGNGLGDNIWHVEHNYNREKYLAGEKYSEPRLSLIPYHEMTTQDWIVTCDFFAVAGDLVSAVPSPPTIIVGYSVSTVSSSISYGLTVSEYRKGNPNITENDMLRAHINWSTGFIPFWGFIPAGIQTWFDWPR